MPTHQLLNGLSGNLQSSTAWSQQQALELIQRNVLQALEGLDAEEKLRFLRLQRNALAALAAVETEKERVVRSFKADGLAQLRGRIGGRDPEQYRFDTTYIERIEQPLPWERQPGSHLRLPRRSDIDYREIVHVKSMSLWEAACVNFGFTTSFRQTSGYSLVDASKVVGPDGDRSLSAREFIAIARDLDLGHQLQEQIQATLGEGGTLRRLMGDAALALLQFDVLDAWRNRAHNGLTRATYDSLTASIDGSGPQLPVESLSLTSGVTPIIAVPFVPWDSSIPVPLMLIKVASLGVLSYFPFRPGGAFRYHRDAQTAEADFRQQLLESHRKNDLGWFSRQLPLVGMSVFKPLLTQEKRPEGMNWLAGHLYDGFHKAFPERTLNDIRFSTDPHTGPAVTLVQALSYRQIQRCQADMDTLASTRSEADWQALKDAAAAIASEVLQLLLTPLPGGVTGMNRVMQLAVLGSMTYSVSVGLSEAVKGDASNFASTLTDVADMAISGRLISVAGRVHRQRMLEHLQRLGNPRKVTRPDGVEELWKPDARPYAHSQQYLLEGKRADTLGVFTVQGRQYVKLHHDNQTLVAEVAHDQATQRYVLKNSSGYKPPIIFNPALQAWTFDLHNTQALSDTQLLQQMLPNGSSVIAQADLEQMLRSTATSRATLEDVWRGEPAPLNLIEGVRRLQADQVIEHIIDHFHEAGYLPPYGDSVVLSLLTQLPEWPAAVLLSINDPQHGLIETYSNTEQPVPDPTTITIIRSAEGSYQAEGDRGLPPYRADPLLSLVINLQPATSQLGLTNRSAATPEQRIMAVRRDVAALARRERLALFAALVSYAGYEKHELLPPTNVRRFLPVKASMPLVAVTPLLKKLRDLNSPLSPALLERLLAQHPLTPRQQQTYLREGGLPTAFAELLDNHRTALRIDAAIDALYHPRQFNNDADQWAREFASALIRRSLKRDFVITEVVAGRSATPYASSGPDDLTVELRHYGKGVYEAYDMRNAGTIAVSPAVDSFYLAIGSVLQPHERQQLGMRGATDAMGLRTTLGDYMSRQRGPEGFVRLADGSLAQYEHTLSLPTNLRPDALGIFPHHGDHYLPLFGSWYRIVHDKRIFKWRLKHPQKIGVDTPTLEHNSDGAWRLSSENPMGWDDHSLLYRLGGDHYTFPQDTASTILALTDTPPHVLRQIHRSGRASPPLLADTCKRLRIDQEIDHFIESMYELPNTSATAPDPDLQLLVVSSLPGWPDSHVLEIVDRDAPLRYPARHRPDAKVVSATDKDLETSGLLEKFIADDDLALALLGALPKTQEQRLFQLITRIVEYTDRERPQILESLYRRSESAGTERERRFKTKHPDLSTSTVKAILGQASKRELKQLHEHDQLSLRLTEQARLSGHELRLNRAFEGLYVDACINADSDRITLYLLRNLPAWPKTLRIDVRERDNQGRLLETAGHLQGSSRKTVAKTNRGYQAYNQQGEPLGQPSNRLLRVILSTLSPDEQALLEADSESGIAQLRNQLAELAFARRVEIKGLLDIPHLQHWMQPAMGVDRSFLVYPLWQRIWPFRGHRPPDLVAKVQELYPHFNNDDARRLLQSLNMTDPEKLIELERRQAEYQAMDVELSRWSETLLPADNELNDPLGMNRGRRRHIAYQLRGAWRRENATFYIAGLFNVPSLELQLDDEGLPPGSFLTGTSGFSHIEYLRISGNSFPATGAEFLGKFTQLKALRIDCRLTDLPSAITDMTWLTHLDLNDNDLRLTEESVQRLATMVNLQKLDLNDNPDLTLTPDVSRMLQLNTLRLANTGITQWPIGASALPVLTELHLQANGISTIPDEVFSNPWLQMANRNTLLHENPLSAETLASIDAYRIATGIRLGGQLRTPAHAPVASNDLDTWLTGVAAQDVAARRQLWEQLQANETASADDVFRVLRDLKRTHAYRSTASRTRLTERVWSLLIAMGESTQLRNTICLNTYGSGNCGDSVLLAFTNMELHHRIHQAKLQPRSYLADRALLELAKSCFYLNQLDHFADQFVLARERADLDVDPAEVTIYLRSKLAREFNLPFYPLELLYSVDDYVTPAVIDDARRTLRRLGQSPALQEAILATEFWVEYLASSEPEAFFTVKDTITYKVSVLDQELSDRRSDEYLERRQQLADEETNEHNRLVRQLTEGTQRTLQRV
ncbi:NEL-type E3 ubiquitin ligase domain-containing protein [Pseudomonas marginalis]|uniref:NEL-type E3 ubiquitin ligase domain-containing protein n=1 Tax=Pseudomonas marginalis TaxID=298 RepID=UPI0038B4280F